MLVKLKRTNSIDSALLLVFMSLFCFALSVCRFLISGTYTYLFLNWNLLLAFIPWIVSTSTIVSARNNRSIMFVMVFTWLIFFPNSPYILTDLFHLREVHTAPVWFDLILILSFAWTGLLFGFISLMNIEQLLKTRLKPSLVNLITIGFLFLSAFGVYLGRFLRWNSWDIIGNPLVLFNDILDRFINPVSHPRTWGFTILTGILLNLMYLSIKVLMNKKRV